MQCNEIQLYKKNPHTVLEHGAGAGAKKWNSVEPIITRLGNEGNDGKRKYL